jgi:hypothetical protein
MDFLDVLIYFKGNPIEFVLSCMNYALGLGKFEFAY